MGVDEDTIAGITAIDAAVDGTLDSSVCEAAAQVLGRQLCALRCRGQIEKLFHSFEPRPAGGCPPGCARDPVCGGSAKLLRVRSMDPVRMHAYSRCYRRCVRHPVVCRVTTKQRRTQQRRADLVAEGTTEPHPDLPRAPVCKPTDPN